MKPLNYKSPQTIEELLMRYNQGERYFVELEFDDILYNLFGVVLEGSNFSNSFF
jgi:hypothetical protein